MPAEPPRRSPAQPGGEFLFKRGDLVFGPVSADFLTEKLASGELGPETQVAREGAAFAPMGEVTVFMEHAARAAARQRVEAQVRAEARATRRRRIAKASVAVLGAALAVAGAIHGVTTAIRSGAFERTHDELADLPIQASPMLVAIAPATDDELEYAGDEREGGKTPSRPRAGRPASAERVAGGASARAGGMDDGARIERNYDPRTIQSVVHANQQRLFPCLRAEAARDPSFRGELPFSFTVGNAGRVVRLWIDRPGYESGPLHACMEAQLAQWKFPAFQGERPSVSLSFRVGGG